MEARTNSHCLRIRGDPRSSTAAISELNSTNSPLLRLPVELRRKIWKSVFGHSVHIWSTVEWQELKSGGWKLAVAELAPLRSYICAAPLSDSENYERSKAYDDNFELPDGSPRYDTEGKRLNHQDCMERENRRPPPGSIPRYEENGTDCDHREKIDLKLLRSCRQMYAEGTDVLYHDTTFHIHDLNTFHRFLSSVSPSNIALLRKMHIYWSEGNVINSRWDFDKLASLPDLPGLRTLHVSIDFSSIHPALSSRYLSDEIYESLWCISLLRFQIYDLERVTVVANDPYVRPDPAFSPCAYLPGGGKMYLHRWARTIEEKRRVAESLRLELLKPNGREISMSEEAVQQRRLEVQEIRDRRIWPCIEYTEF